MNLLAFDTATERMSVALQVGAEVISADAAGGAQASAALLPTIQRLLAEAGISISALDAIAFGRGPGAFTGLRTACAAAQGLAYGADKPVLPIDTLLAIADDAVQDAANTSEEASHDARGGAGGFRVWALLDARMGEVYAAQYRHTGPQGWEVLDAPMLTRPAALNERWRLAQPAAVAGNALAVFADALDVGSAARHPAAVPSARALLRLAGPLWSQGRGVDAALALPLYLRDKVADTTLERAAARAAKERAAADAALAAPSP